MKLLLLLPVHAAFVAAGLNLELPPPNDPRYFWFVVCLACASMLWLARSRPSEAPDL